MASQKDMDAKDSEQYQSKEHKQHILDLPDTYIGSKDPTLIENIWRIVEKDEKIDHFEQNSTHVPTGLQKIFDEILVNATDNKERTQKLAETDESVQVTKNIKVNISEDGTIVVYNDGDGLPVVEHAEKKVLIPEMVFGTLLTSGNYKKDEEKTWGGRNGYGAKLANIFSLRFEVETVDHRRKKKFKQVWTDHMSEPAQKAKVTSYSSKPYTEIRFLPDYAYFGMKSGITPEMIDLVRKRTIDMAGWLDKSVSVFFQDVKVPVKGFDSYVSLYIGDAKRVYEAPNDRWEVVACASPDGQPRQVSFVNGICTYRGGKHVEYIVNQITRKLCDRINNKRGKKEENSIKPQHVKNNLWVFVKARIVNPAFSSQTKEEMTTAISAFGSKCELSDDFFKKLEKTEIVERAKLLKGFHDQAGLQKTDGKKTTRIKGVPKLEDANWAGSAKSDQCTLIVTEGDSAKAFAMAGLKVVGPDRYGVFPIRGKLMNVRDSSDKKISENEEIQALKKILGLQHGKVYTSRKDLRYGELMILTDQDHDGSHIKGLLLNFVDYFWQSLLPLDFVVSFYTPIVKISKKEKVLATFYNLADYREWKRTHPEVSSDQIKYYKGLGTSTSKEAREYFHDLKKITYKWSDQAKEALDLAFDKERADSRKEWLRFYRQDNTLDMKEQNVPIQEFINKELIHFSQYDNERSIPSMMDGFKPSQRKVLYGVLKRKQTKDIKVSQLVGPISSDTSYHHGETSMVETMVCMAQDFVGSNNVNLLVPSGQFGTRLMGGDDHSSARYIFTRLEPITRFIFREEDEPLLKMLEDDGKPIEPQWYLPVIPMLLVNGTKGIGTGFSTHVPSFHPADIIQEILHLMEGKSVQPLTPWYRGFTGKIEKKGRKWFSYGKYEIKNATTVEVTELPIGVWTDKYTQHLTDLEVDSTDVTEKKKKLQCLTSFTRGKNHSEDSVHFILKFKGTTLNDLKKEPEELLDRLKLVESKSSSVTNIHVFDPMGNMVKFKTVEGILRAFYKIRLLYYVRRKEYQLQDLEHQVKMLDEKIRFIRGIIEETVQIYKKKDPEVVTELRNKHKFLPNPLNLPIVLRPISLEVFTKALEGEVFPVGVESEMDSSVEEDQQAENEESDSSEEESSEEESEEEEEEEEKAVQAVVTTKETRDATKILHEDYGYLVSLQIRTFTQEKVDELENQRKKKVDELESLRQKTPKDLWRTDLLELKEALVAHEKAWLKRRTDDPE